MTIIHDQTGLTLRKTSGDRRAVTTSGPATRRPRDSSPRLVVPATRPRDSYVNSVEGKAIYYLTDDSAHPSGYSGTETEIGLSKRVLKAINPLTGKPVWTHEYNN